MRTRFCCAGARGAVAWAGPRLTTPISKARSRKQQPTSSITGHSATSHATSLAAGDLAGMTPPGLVSQNESTLTARLSTTETPRKAEIFHSQRQRCTHQGAGTESFKEEVVDATGSDMTDTPSFHLCCLKHFPASCPSRQSTFCFSLFDGKAFMQYPTIGYCSHQVRSFCRRHVRSSASATSSDCSA